MHNRMVQLETTLHPIMSMVQYVCLFLGIDGTSFCDHLHKNLKMLIILK